MSFDADRWRAAHWAPWSVTIGGHTYVARELSAPEVERFQDDYGRASTRSEAAAMRVIRRFLRRLFPGLFWWTRPDPVEAILRLPAAGMREVLANFFAHRSRRRMPRAIPNGSSHPAAAA